MKRYIIENDFGKRITFDWEDDQTPPSDSDFEEVFKQSQTFKSEPIPTPEYKKPFVSGLPEQQKILPTAAEEITESNQQYQTFEQPKVELPRQITKGGMSKTSGGYGVLETPRQPQVSTQEFPEQPITPMPEAEVAKFTRTQTQPYVPGGQLSVPTFGAESRESESTARMYTGGVAKRAGEKLQQVGPELQQDVIERGRQLAESIGLTPDKIKGFGSVPTKLSRALPENWSDEDKQATYSYGISVLQGKQKALGAKEEAFGKAQVQKAFDVDPVWLKADRIRDDITKLENTDPGILRSWRKGDLGLGIDQKVFDVAMSGDEEAFKQIADVKTDYQNTYIKMTDEEGKKGWVEKNVHAVAEMLPGMTKGAALSAIPGIGTALGQSYWARQGGGDIIYQATRRGVPLKDAIPMGIGGGLVYAAIEGSQVGKLSTLDPFLKGVLTNRVASFLISRPLETLDESLEEGAQQVMTDLSVMNAIKSAGITVDQKKEFENALKDGFMAFKQSLVPMGALGLLGTVKGGVKLARQPKGVQNAEGTGISTQETGPKEGTGRGESGQVRLRDNAEAGKVTPAEISGTAVSVKDAAANLSDEEAAKILAKAKAPKVDVSKLSADEVAGTLDRAKFDRKQAEKARPQEPSPYQLQQPTDENRATGEAVAKKYGLRFKDAVPGDRDKGGVKLVFTDPITDNEISLFSATADSEAAKITDRIRQEKPEEYGKKIADGAGVEFLGRKAQITEAIAAGKYNTEAVGNYRTKLGNEFTVPFSAGIEEVRTIAEETDKQGAPNVPEVQKRKEEVEPQETTERTMPVNQDTDRMLRMYVNTGKTETSPSRAAHQSVIGVLDQVAPEDIADAVGITPAEAREAIGDIRALKKSNLSQKVRQTLAPSLFYGQPVQEVVDGIKQPRSASGEVMFSREGKKGVPEYDRLVEIQRQSKGLTAAIKDPETGKIYSGWTHQKAIESVPSEDIKASARLFGEWDRSTNNVGFVDNDGNFISRDEADKKFAIQTMEDLRDLQAGRNLVRLFHNLGDNDVKFYREEHTMDLDTAKEMALSNGFEYVTSTPGDGGPAYTFKDKRTGTEFNVNTRGDVRTAAMSLSDRIAPKGTVKAGEGIRFSRERTPEQEAQITRLKARKEAEYIREVQPEEAALWKANNNLIDFFRENGYTIQDTPQGVRYVQSTAEDAERYWSEFDRNTSTGFEEDAGFEAFGKSRQAPRTEPAEIRYSREEEPELIYDSGTDADRAHGQSIADQLKNVKFNGIWKGFRSKDGKVHRDPMLTFTIYGKPEDLGNRSSILAPLDATAGQVAKRRVEALKGVVRFQIEETDEPTNLRREAPTAVPKTPRRNLPAKGREAGNAVPETVSAVVALTRAIERDLGQELPEGSITAVDAPQEEVYQVTDRLVSEEFGRTPVWFGVSRETEDAGVRIGGALMLNRPNDVFINTNTKKPVIVTAVHETMHIMQEEHPDLYKDLATIMVEEGTLDFDKYIKKMIDKGYSKEEVMYEVVSEISGERFTDPEFLNALHDRSPEAFRAFVETLRRVIQQIKDWIRKSGIEHAGKYFVDLNRVDRVLQDSLIEMRRRGQPEMKMAAQREARFSKEKADQTQTEAFRNWFKGSKVVDENGEPLVVYHGTNAEKFNIFNTGNFTVEQKLASDFPGKNENSRVYPVYLSIKKPLRVEDPGLWVGTDFRDYLVDKKILSKEQSFDLYKKQSAMFGGRDVRQNEIFKTIGEITGYDGIIYKNKFEGEGTDSYIAFSPTQIKSAIGNRGTFDPENPDIRFSREEPYKVVDKRAAHVTKEELPAIYEEAKTFDGKTAAERLKKRFGIKKQSLALSRYILRTVSGTLLEISPVVRDALQKQVNRVLIDTAKANRRILLLVKAISKMPEEDAKVFDIVAKNADSEKINELAGKYGFRDALDEYRKVMDEIVTRAREAGYETGYLKDYFPRIPKDRDAYRNYIRGLPEWGQIEEAMREKSKSVGHDLNEDEQAEFLNLYIRGYGNKMQGGPGQLKERTVKYLDNEMNALLEDTRIAIPLYVEGMIKKIARKEFFGNKKETDELYINDIDQSIGDYVAEQIRKKNLDPVKQDQLVGLLKSYFNYKPTNQTVAAIKNLGYAASMGSGFSSMFSQMQDSAFGFYTAPGSEAGSIIRSLLGKTEITIKDLGIDDIAAEFRDPGKLAKFVDRLLRGVGLKYGDSIFKNAFIDANLKKYRAMAKSGKINKDFKRDLDNTFGDEAESVIADLKSGVDSDNVKLLMLNQISKFQPVTLLQVPQAYLDAPRARVAYALKTYQVNQFNAIIDESIRAMDGAKDVKAFGRAFGRIAGVTACLIAAGVGTDRLKDFLFRRQCTWGQYTVDNILKLMFISRYVTWQAREQGLYSAIVKLVAPPMSWMDYIGKDINKAFTKPEDFKLKDMESVRILPVVGQEFYWWTGGGYEKQLKQAIRKSEPKKFQRELNKREAKAEKVYAKGDTLRARELQQKAVEYREENKAKVEEYYEKEAGKEMPRNYNFIIQNTRTDTTVDPKKRYRAMQMYKKMTPGQQAKIRKYKRELNKEPK